MKHLLTSDDQAEVDAQGAFLDMLEERFAARFASEVIGTTMQMVSEYEATRSAPQLPMGHAGAMGDIYRVMALQSIEVFGGRVVDQGKSRGLVLETKSFEEFFKRLAQQYIALEAIRQRISAVSSFTRSLVVSAIDRGNVAGLGVEAIAKQITEEAPAIARRRASIIARTETHGAANYGANEAARSLGLDLTKKWISVEDGRTRDFVDAMGEGVAEYDHRSMNGQTVPMDDAFLMPWRKGDPIRIMYPGEAGQPAGAVINCRCAVGYLVAD